MVRRGGGAAISAAVGRVLTVLACRVVVVLGHG
jgi:hypothetical protein